jgi:hypothetical protein
MVVEYIICSITKMFDYQDALFRHVGTDQIAGLGRGRRSTHLKVRK